MPRVLDTTAVNKKRRISETGGGRSVINSKSESKDANKAGLGNGQDLKSPLFDFITPQVNRWTSPKILDKLQIKYEKIGSDDILAKAGVESLSEDATQSYISDLLVVKDLLQKYVTLDASIIDLEKEITSNSGTQKYLLAKVEEAKENKNYIFVNTPSLKKEITTVLPEHQRGKAARALVYAREFIEKVMALFKTLQDKKQAFENSYRDVFLSFSQMCLLFPFDLYDRMGEGTKRPQIIRGQTVLSTPDSRFLRTYCVNPDKPRVGLVASVAVEPSAKSDDSNALPAPFSFRHAGELLSEVNGSPACPYAIGIAIQKTIITFTCFVSQPSYIAKLRDAMEMLTADDTAAIYYSQSYDMLSSNDRDKLVETMLRLSTLYTEYLVFATLSPDDCNSVELRNFRNNSLYSEVNTYEISRCVLAYTEIKVVTERGAEAQPSSEDKKTR